MPNINITDSRKRDAVVKAESVRIYEPVQYVGPKGGQAYTRKVLKATVEHDYESLSEDAGSPEALGKALIESDPEVDLERFGMFLWNVSRVYINEDEEIVFRVEQNELVKDPWGKLKERRPRRRAEANVDADIPLTWTGHMIDKHEAVRRFVFSSKMQIVHINGLTYDFLHGMATELARANSLMLLGGGKSGKKPLVFRRGSVAYRGFLEGRVDGDKYILLLHLSNTELKVPAGKRTADPADDDELMESGKSAARAPKEKGAAAEKTTKKKTARKKAAKKKSVKKKSVKKKAVKKKTVGKKTPKKDAARKKADDKKTRQKKASKKKARKKKGASKKKSSKKTAKKAASRAASSTRARPGGSSSSRGNNKR